MKGWNDVHKCPVCGYEGTFVPEVTVSSNEFIVPWMDGEIRAGYRVNYVRCIICGMKFQSPRPSAELLEKYYSSGQYRAEVGDTVTNMDADEMSRAERLAVFIKSVVPNAYSHVDWGSSRGYLLDKVGAERQMGIDYNTGYNQNKRAVVVSPSEAAHMETTFQLVTAIHVLEHVLDPIAELRKYVRFMSKEAFGPMTGPSVLFVEVPFRESPYRMVHTLAFEPHSLGTALRLAGLQITHLTAEPHLLIAARLI